MALSEKEQRLLEQLEASLSAEDPKLARTLGSRTPRKIHGRRAGLAGLGFLAGVALLIVGMQTVWVLSVIGFLVMLASTIVALGAWQHVTKSDDNSRSVNLGDGSDFMGKMEDRWRRRQQGNW